MKTYLRLIRFNGKIFSFLTPFTIFSILYTLFSALNITILIPLLDILFGTYIDISSSSYTKGSLDIQWNIQYIKDILYYYFGSFTRSYGKLYSLYLVCSVALVANLLSNLFRYISIQFLERAKARCIHNMRTTLFNKMITLHIGYFSTHRRGDIMSRAAHDLHEIEFSITTALGSFLRDPISIVIYFFSLFIMSVELTLFTLIIIPIFGILINLLVKRLREDSKKTQHTLGIIMGMIDEMIHGIRLIKAFNAVDYLKEKFHNESALYSLHYKNISYRREAASPISELIGVSVVILITLYGGHMILSDQSRFTASMFIVYIMLFSRAFIPIKSMFSSISSVQKTLISGKRILDILDTPPMIQDREGADVLNDFSHEIAFENVYFSYEEITVLKDISFKIPKGKSFALVGPSGGGKSTIADLLPRFYDIKKGRISIDGKDISSYTMSSLRNKMGIVTQESILFNDTIFNNIAFGNPHADITQVIQSAKIANAHHFIMETPNGYQTFIGDRGIKLSGGQRQRISIARAIFKNPPILILDEATSSLDTESERLVQEALENLMKNRTSLVVAHRLSTIQNVHQILVIHKGKIIEKGTHDQLINKNGLYNKLQRMQTI